MANNEKILKVGNAIFSTNAPEQLILLLSTFNESNFESVILNCGFYCENITEFFEICLN